MRNHTVPAAVLGLPTGMTREQIEQHIERLIDYLDTLDPDADAEPWLGSALDGCNYKDRFDQLDQTEWAHVALGGNPLHDLEYDAGDQPEHDEEREPEGYL